MPRPYDVAIVGGGLLGLATAYRLLEARPELRLAILEKESELALHQSARNSGVLHAGLYYAPGSLKARLCRRGKEELERFAEEHGIPFERSGKLVIATRDEDLPRLAALAERGRANGLAGLEEIGPERIRELEPHVVGLRALHAPETGIVDFRRVALALADELGRLGADVLPNHGVIAIAERGAEVRLRTDAGPVVASFAVTCGGLHSDRLAAMTGTPGDQRIVPFRGDYCLLRPAARSLVRGLVYPVPDPAMPFLGVHLTRRIDGQVWLGPNAVLALAREGYRRRDVSLRDVAELLAFPGFRRLARRYWRTGLDEQWRDLSKGAFVRACRRLLPELREDMVGWGPTGIRAQTVTTRGALVDDFSLQEAGRVLHVRNAPSPAATSCLAIGRVLADRTIERIGPG